MDRNQQPKTLSGDWTLVVKKGVKLKPISSSKDTIIIKQNGKFTMH